MNAEFEEFTKKQYPGITLSLFMRKQLEPCWQAAQTAQKRKDAEIARGRKDPKYPLSAYTRLCEDIAKAIEEQEGV